jgi:hypothetical protein
VFQPNADTSGAFGGNLLLIAAVAVILVLAGAVFVLAKKK